jgi:ABC-type multidrug transport system fused ATPase/permease subunit
MLASLYWEFTKKYTYTIIVYFALHFSIALDKIALPHFYGKLIARIKGGSMETIAKLFFMLILIWASIQGLNILKSLVNARLYPRFIGFIRIKLVNQIIDTNKNNYQDLETGKFITKMIESPYIFFGFAKELKNILVNNMITYVSTFIYLFIYDKFVSLVYLVSMSVIMYMIYVYVNNCKKYVRESEYSYIDLHEQLDDTMNNLMSIYTSSQIKKEEERVEKFSDESVNNESSLIIHNTEYRAYFSIAFIVIFIVLNYFTFKSYLDGRVKINILVSIVIINYTILQEFLSIFYDVKDFMDNKERLTMLDEYLDSFPKAKKNTRQSNIKTNQVFIDDFVNIEFKDVSFKYQDNWLFENFNLLIEPRQKIGLIGNIGSGKSTLVKLMVGLKSDYTGQILINGRNINTLNIDKMRKYISYIPQHPKLFDRTLYENISYGLDSNEVSEKKIYQTLESVGLHSVSDKFRKIMHKKVGKNGSDLSGGQRQIVWLVRSLLKNNRMIILDEPTSSLDDDNKQKIITLIEALSQRRNIILITHDKKVLQNMDRIIKLDKGKIIEDIKVKQLNQHPGSQLGMRQFQTQPPV